MRKTPSFISTHFFQQRPYHQSQTAWNEDEDSKATNFRMQHGDSKRASVGSSKEAVHNHGYKAGHNTMWHNRQKHTTNYNRDMNKHQLQNKKAKKFQHQQKGQWTPSNRWRGHQRPAFRNSRGCSKNNKQVTNDRFKSGLAPYYLYSTLRQIFR